MSPNQKRYLYGTLELLFCVFIPAAIIANEYDLYYRVRYFTRLQITLTGFIVLMVVILSLKKRISLWVKSWPTSVGKSIVDIFINMLPMIAMTGILLIAKYKVDRFIEIWWLVLGSYAIGLLFKQWHDKWIEEVIETRRANTWPRNP